MLRLWVFTIWCWGPQEETACQRVVFWPRWNKTVVCYMLTVLILPFVKTVVYWPGNIRKRQKQARLDDIWPGCENSRLGVPAILFKWFRRVFECLNKGCQAWQTLED